LREIQAPEGWRELAGRRFIICCGSWL